MRRVLAIAALLVLAGCVSLPALPGSESGTPMADGGPAPPDPDGDPIGWESGYWHNESLDGVDASDGLTDAELEAVVARAMARVEYLRGIEFDSRVPVETLTREEYANRTGGGNRSGPGPGLVDFDNAKMEALLLIGEDTESIGVQRQNRNVSVQGFYSPARDRIVIVTAGPNASIEETTLGHELVHAWQDRRYGLGNYTGRTRDRVNAVNALVEGDANYVSHRYRDRCGAVWDCVSPPAPEGGGNGGGGGLANVGVYVMKYFPYSDGPSFVRSHRRAGGWDAVEDLYGNPPASAEQVIHPDRYESDPPTAVDLADTNSGAWTRVRPEGRPDYGVLGESAIAAMFVYPLYDSEGATAIVPPEEWFNRADDGDLNRFDPFEYGNRYGTGWDGDRFHVYRDERNQTAYVWKLVWDDAGEAREFVDGYRRLLAYRGADSAGPGTYVVRDGGFADAFWVEQSGNTVVIVNAPSVEDLSAVRDGAGPPAGATPGPDPTVGPQSQPGVEDIPELVGVPGFSAPLALLAIGAAVAGLAVGRRRD